MLRIISPAASPRLAYIAAWLETLWGLPVAIQQAGSEVAEAAGPCITYGTAGHPDAVLHIPDEGLLWRAGIDKSVEAPGIKAALEAGLRIAPDPVTGVPATSFDVLSHTFFHLSRYEEYGSAARDEHNRFPATESVLYQSGMLRRPMVDVWLSVIKAALSPPFRFPENRFSFQPTYDIDAAWAMQHKGLVRVGGALLREAGRGGLKAAFAKALHVLKGGKDPHDPYDLLEALHGSATTRLAAPRFFILAANRRTPFDKNIPLRHPAMQALAKRLGGIGTIGLHPSYYATDAATFRQEKQLLEAATGLHSITHSRQHFMRLRMPDTYRMLLAQGITDDWTMGYGSHLGFRAGTGRPFLWYDPEAEQVTGLRVHPFCFMDSTAHYHEKLTGEAAFNVLSEMVGVLRRCDSRLVTIFHNYSLGSDAAWAGWRKHYAQFAGHPD